MNTNNRVELRPLITRQMLRNEPDKIFLFGDNLLRSGLGGQAAEMRGEPNAIGIPTKRAPNMRPESFFSDDDYINNIKSIDDAIGSIPPDKIIVMPQDGLGTGRAKLQQKAPKTYAYLQNKLNELKQ